MAVQSSGADAMVHGAIVSANHPRARQDWTETLMSCRGLWKVFGGHRKEVRAILDSGRLRDDKIASLAQIGVFTAVADVGVDIARGEILCVMGLSGSGKSTMIRCLSRLVDPEAGEVHLAGRDLLKAGNAELIDIRRRKIGMVFQNFGLLGHLTALENVAFPIRAQGVSLAERRRRAAEMLDLVGLAGREDHYPSQLSGGQQQRVGIARSLITDPDLWFLDEPFSALDPLIRRQMQDELLGLQARLHKTIIFVTHDFLEAARLGQRIMIMKDGKVVQVGTVAELILSPADDYVRDFVSDVPTLRVLKAGQCANPLTAPLSSQAVPFVNAGESLERALGLFMEGAERVGVRSADGDVIGVLDRALISRLVGRSGA